MTNWEREAMKLGQIRETADPETHTCPTAGVVRPGAPMSGGAGRNWHLFGDLIRRSESIIDMGGLGGDNYACAIPWAVQWDMALGRDMRDTKLLRGFDRRFDLIHSSHSIEHVPPDDVPQMLSDWCGILKPGGHIIITAPHPCSQEWSVLKNEEGHCCHLWAPSCSAVGNYLQLMCGLQLVAYDDHYCSAASWWLVMRKGEPR